MGNESTQGIPPPLAGADSSGSTSVPNAIIPPSLITEPGAASPIVPGANSTDVKLDKEEKEKENDKNIDRYVTLPGTASLSEVSSTLESNGVPVISLSDACAGCARHGPDGDCPSDEEEEEFDLGSYPRKFDVDMESQLSGTTKPYARQVRFICRAYSLYTMICTCMQYVFNSFS